jgi:hypothetical protein
VAIFAIAPKAVSLFFVLAGATATVVTNTYVWLLAGVGLGVLVSGAGMYYHGIMSYGAKPLSEIYDPRGDVRLQVGMAVSLVVAYIVGKVTRTFDLGVGFFVWTLLCVGNSMIWIGLPMWAVERGIKRKRREIAEGKWGSLGMHANYLTDEEWEICDRKIDKYRGDHPHWS